MALWRWTTPSPTWGCLQVRAISVFHWLKHSGLPFGPPWLWQFGCVTQNPFDRRPLQSSDRLWLDWSCVRRPIHGLIWVLHFQEFKCLLLRKFNGNFVVRQCQVDQSQGLLWYRLAISMARLGITLMTPLATSIILTLSKMSALCCEQIGIHQEQRE